MKSVLITLLAIMIISIPPQVLAEQTGTRVVIDLMDLDSATRNSVLNQLKARENEKPAKGIVDSLPKMDPNSAREWANAVTNIIRDICHNLNVEVNEFIKTPVGMIVAGTVVYKVMGKDIIKAVSRAVFGVLGWAITMVALFFLARKYLLPRKVKKVRSWQDREKGKIEEVSYVFEQPYDFQSRDARALANLAVYGTAAVATFIAALLVLA